ncbi:MAG: hypothetical protein P4L57_14340 [Rhizomicrobium sp.]|nr:hypothetical protein [Rhizomicrobium sp.]
MRFIPILLGSALAVMASAAAQDDMTNGPSQAFAHVDVVPDANAIRPSSKDAPVLEAITTRYSVRAPNGVVLDAIPDFHFHAPNGNAIVLRRELIATNGAFAQTQIANATINIPPAGQKGGAVVSGGWRCGTGIYYVTMRAFILDADGNRSNSLTYTIHCNGG